MEYFPEDEDNLHAFVRALAVIIVSEIGDKTFLIAALLSMHHSRLTVLAGALTALALMSFLSSLLGTILPSLLPRKYTMVAAGLLFWVFGFNMVKEGLAMSESESDEKMKEEMREVQQEIEGEFVEQKEVREMEDLEEGAIGNNFENLSAKGTSLSPPLTPRNRPSSPGLQRRQLSGSKNSSPQSKLPGIVTTMSEGAKNLFSLCLSPVFVKAFILTFLAEWGDRSQITTIALAAAHNVWLITIGTTLGHSFCTCLAVMAGRWIATKISVRKVTLIGAVLFLLFGFVYLYEAYWYDSSNPLTEISSRVGTEMGAAGGKGFDV